MESEDDRWAFGLVVMLGSLSVSGVTFLSLWEQTSLTVTGSEVMFPRGQVIEAQRIGGWKAERVEWREGGQGGGF